MERVTEYLRKIKIDEIDEYDELKRYYEIFKEPVCIEMRDHRRLIKDAVIRYIRYMMNIEDWMGYSYIKEDIKKFLYEKDIIKKTEMMISLDRRLYEIVTRFKIG